MINPTKKFFYFKEIPNSAKFAIIAFFMALAYSLIITVWSVYIKSFVGEDYIVGFVISFLTIISLLSYIFTIPIIKKYNKSKIFKKVIFLLAVFYAILALNKSFYGFLGIATLVTFLSTLRINSFGIMIKENSSNKEISKNEGLIYTFLNMAWLIGPIIAGFFAFLFGTRFIFLIASILFLLVLILFDFSGINSTKAFKRNNKHKFKELLTFFKDKHRIFAYLLGGGVNFWWVLIYIFMPLYIIEQGFGTQYIGYFLFAVAIPLILFEYPFSRLIGKLKYKTLFKIGYLIPAVLAFLCFFMTNSYILFLLLILSSLGLAMIEPTTEAYFLRLMNQKQELKYYGIYNTTIDLSMLVAAFISSSILLIFPFKFLFLLFALIMFLLFLLSFKTKNIK